MQNKSQNLKHKVCRTLILFSILIFIFTVFQSCTDKDVQTGNTVEGIQTVEPTAKKSPFEIAEELADILGGTDVIRMAAEMIGADSGASFKIGEDKFEIYSFSDSDILKEAESGSLTMKSEWFGEYTMYTTVSGNFILCYETTNEKVIEQFKAVTSGKSSGTVSTTSKPTTTTPPDTSVTSETTTAKKVITSDNPYIVLSQEDPDTYLLLLRIVGTCYKSFVLPFDLADEMESNNLNEMVGNVLNYKIDEKSLLPAFSESFTNFFSNGVHIIDYPDEKEALEISFDLEYDPQQKCWSINPK